MAIYCPKISAKALPNCDHAGHQGAERTLDRLMLNAY